MLLEVKYIRFNIFQNTCRWITTVSSKIREWVRELWRQRERGERYFAKKYSTLTDCCYLQKQMGGCHSTSGVKSFLMDWKVSLGIQKLACLSISKGVVLTRMTLAWSHLDLTEWKLNQISFEQDLLWTLPRHHLEKGLMTQFDRGNVCR